MLCSSSKVFIIIMANVSLLVVVYYLFLLLTTKTEVKTSNTREKWCDIGCILARLPNDDFL